MNPKTTRMLAAGAVVVVALALLLIVRPGDSDNGNSDESTTQEQATSKSTGNTGPTSAPQSKPPQPEKPVVPVYRVVDGQPVGGVQKLEANEGALSKQAAHKSSASPAASSSDRVKLRKLKRPGDPTRPRPRRRASVDSGRSSRRRRAT